ncbi:hypothetical protein R1sor_003647 [Riccia sorocarpa]|uniref:Uncharacterized protein n=1 Tax=Riccia sorocarpa TaxID=122646 RepID=A0ABD3H5N4_9MARC
MEKLPETMEKILQVIEEIPQSFRKLSETLEIHSQTMEKLPQTVEMLSQTVGKLAQTLEKLPQTVETSIDKEIQDEWFEAMREEDGYTLMTLVVRKPQLLTLTYRGRNALHLAMRNNWYGLVQEIVLQFQHLYSVEDGSDDESSSYRMRLELIKLLENERSITEAVDGSSINKAGDGSSTTEGDGSSSNRLNLDAFRDLLTCKEGGNQMSETSEGGSSGLDVLGMAVTQGHQAINTMLVRAISNLPSLFHGHSTYKQGDFEAYECFHSSETTDEERKNLCDLLGRYCLELGCMADLDHAPNMESVPGEGFWSEWSSPLTRQDIIDHWKDPFIDDTFFEYPVMEEHLKNWMLTCPFLPLSEYLILEYSTNRNNIYRADGDESTVFTPLLKEGDTFLSKRPEKGATRAEFQKCFIEKLDSSTSFVKYVASISDTRRAVWHYAILNSPFWWEKNVEKDIIFHKLIFTVSASDLADIYNMKDSSGRTALHLLVASDPPPCFVHYREGHPLSEAHFLPWLLRSEGWDRWAPEEGVPEILGRRKGVTADISLTPLQYCVMKGYTTFVQRMVQDDRYYNPARMNGADEQSRLSSQSQKSDHALEPPLLSVAKHADPEMLRIMLGTGKFDLHCQDQDGNTLLHAAVCCEDPVSLPTMLVDFVEIPKECPHESHYLEHSLMTKAQQREREERHRESRRQGCMNLLLQEGLDIWETNAAGQIADPGPKASPE